ncbi:MAG: asparagine synthase (glutamine-hydrolyzing) [Acidimicrobiales bacterium]|nr:asparagine synthase (glutamine-hydrolyzing) [Acidimicrobiales bacterium]
MCGISGIVTRQARRQELELEILTMNYLQSHRGPDAEGIWIDPASNVALGHRRLSIIDLEESGLQPMTDGQRWLVFNGEIYNYRELRSELGEENFRSQSDSEVILVGFDRWGPEVLQKLRGMFSFAIWDPKERRLFAARDRFGIKPFYYSFSSETFRFSSEAKALLPFGDSTKVSETGLVDYMMLQLPLGQTTLFEGINQLLPGHYLDFTLDNFSKMQVQRCYWEVEYERDFDHDEQYFLEHLEALFDESIDLHCRSDVPIGGYVSGGIDSSLVSIAASEASSDFIGFTGKFEEPPGYDESQYAVWASEKADFELFQCSMTPQDFLNVFPKVIYHLDYPIAGPGSFPQYMVSELASKHRKVVLGGQGGDEIFGGYTRYLVAYLEQALKGAINGTGDEANFILSYQSLNSSLQSLQGYEPMLSSFWSKGLFGPRDERYIDLVDRSSGTPVADWVKDSDYSAREEALKLFRAENVESGSYFDEMTHFDFKSLLPGLLHVEDRVSMAHGLEARVPFLDHKIIEFAATVPSDIKFKDGKLKRFLIESLGKRLPDQILQRKDKMGFPVPLDVWARSNPEVNSFILDTLNSAKNRDMFPLQIPNTSNLDKVPLRALWGMISLEIWFQTFFDRPAISDHKALLRNSDIPVTNMHEKIL